MNIEVKVPEDIEQKVAQALLDSLIGERLNEAVQKVCDAIVVNDYKSPVRTALENMAQTIIREMLQTPENKEKIEQAILDAFSSNQFKEYLAERVFNKLQGY